MATDASIEEQLRAYIGERVCIRSAVVHHNTYAMLTDVKVMDNGQLWAYFDDGTAIAVVSENLEIDVAPYTGTFDQSPATEQLTAVHDILDWYGPTPEQQRQRCSCSGCHERHEREDAERDQKLRDERDRREAKERDSGKAEAPQEQPDNSRGYGRRVWLNDAYPDNGPESSSDRGLFPDF